MIMQITKIRAKISFWIATKLWTLANKFSNKYYVYTYSLREKEREEAAKNFEGFKIIWTKPSSEYNLDIEIKSKINPKKLG